MNISSKIISNHSRNKLIAKLVLSFLITTLVLAVIVSPFIKSKHENLRMVFGNEHDLEDNSQETGTAVPTTKITMPKYYGIDSNERPFTIDADEGVQFDENQATLTNVYGDIKIDEKEFLEFQATTAVIDLQNKSLKFTDGINIKSNQNLSANTAESYFSPKDSTINGDKGIFVKNNSNTVIADSFIIKNDYNIIIFSNNVKMVIRNE